MQRRAVAMRRIFLGLMVCGLAAALPAHGADAPDTAPANPPMAASDPSLCLDGMETVPDDDDLVPQPASVDGGCSVSDTPIAT